MLYCSTDIETTGLDPETCDIIEFGAVLDNLSDQKPLDQLPTFHRYILPKDGLYRGQPMALSFHAEIFRRIATHDPQADSQYQFCTADKLGWEFSRFLDKHARFGRNKVKITPAGKNFSSFDLSFLLKVPNFQNHVGLERVSTDAQVSLAKRAIDPGILFWEESDETIPDTKTCLKRAGIDASSSHTAVQDALIVVQLVRAGMKKVWGR